MSKTTKFFGTCNGETVLLSHTGYVPGQYLDSASRLNESIPTQVEKYRITNYGELLNQFAYAVGSCPKCEAVHFANRRIERPAQASNHKCGGKCRSAKGPNCECSCGGANHGAGN